MMRTGSSTGYLTILLLSLTAQPARSGAQCHGRPIWQEPVQLRTGAIQKAQALDPELNLRLQAARRLAWAAERAGHEAEATLRYEQNWLLLPPSTGRWDNSIVVATDGLQFHFDGGRWNEALQWAQRLKIAQQGGQNAELLIWLGKIRYEQGMLDTARACFALAHERWGDRIFGGRIEDGKYYTFFHDQGGEPP